MPSQYGHTNHGINMTNYRLLSAKQGNRDGFRAPADWGQESFDQMNSTLHQTKMSATLRHASQGLQDATQRMVENDMGAVDHALRAKLGQTETLRGMLEVAHADVMSEMNELVTLKGRLEERLNTVDRKLNLNNNRMQTRSARPSREKTMDDVERSLIQQQGLLGSFNDKVRRAISHIDRELGQLDSVKQKLEADLRDKADALVVDETVLRIPATPEVANTLSRTMRKNHECSNKTPHTWVRNTEENLKLANHWINDSKRLRKAVRYAIQHNREAEHLMAGKLNENMIGKLNTTKAMRDNLEQELERIRDEAARAKSERNALAAALESKRGPLAQAKERLAVRKARPCRETVGDEVEAALAREIANLAGATAVLSEKLNAVDKEISNLGVAAASLEDNIKDKDQALNIDEHTIFMDGRMNLVTPPPSSVASFAMSELSTARSATLQRIRDMEATLATARRDRMAMESSVRQLRDSLTSPLPSPTAGTARNQF